MSYASKVIIGDRTHLVGSNLYGVCNSEASAVTKVVELSDFDRFLVGVTIHVKFTYSNTAAEPKININSLGEKPMYLYEHTCPGVTPDTSWDAGAVLSLTYDGTAWIVNDWINTNVGVQQVETDALIGDRSYSILFAGSGSDVTEKNVTRKDERFRYNPETHRMMVGKIIMSDSDQYYAYDPETYGIDVRDSDIINCSGIWFQNAVDASSLNAYGGLMFKRSTSDDYDALYCKDGVLYVEQKCHVPTSEVESTTHNTRGTVRKIMSDINMPSQNRIRGGTTVRTIPASQWYNIFTNAQVDEILDVTGSDNNHVSMTISNGDYNARAIIIDSTVYNPNSGWWVHFQTMPSAGTFRFNYIIYYWV